MTTKAKAADDCLGQEFVITREFAAPRELVFKAWTDEKQLAQWWGPRGFTNPVCEWDASPGKKIHVVMRAPNGTDYPMGGEFCEIAAPERLVFTSGAMDDKGAMLFEFLHTATFTEKDGKTLLTLHSKVTRTSSGAGRYIGGFEAGMTQSLEKLEEYLESQPFVIERTYDAPVALVWRALSSRKDIERWFFDFINFEAKPGCEFEFVVEHEGNKFHHLCKVTEVILQKKIAYTWRYKGVAGESLVTFELFPEGNKTKVKLTHDGLETFPKLPQYARKNFAGGWTQLIGASLKDFAETVEREIYIMREFNAPRELVWQAMTDPKHVVNWWGPRGFTTTIEEMDVRPGGAWKHVMHGPDGTNYPNKSIFKEVVKPEKLVFAHGGGRENGPGATFVATWTFDEVGKDKTKVSIHMVFPTTEARDFVVKEFGAIEGGKQTLERLGEHVDQAQGTPFVITREFNAPRDRVWKAWTQREHLAQWFGPKGFTMSESKMDFRPGGVFHYCVRNPQGVEMWGKFVYREIMPPQRLTWVFSFSDKDGGSKPNPFGKAQWPLHLMNEAVFSESGGKTTVTLKSYPLDATDEERRTFEGARGGMTQGWTGTFEQLDEYLQKL